MTDYDLVEELAAAYARPGSAVAARVAADQAAFAAHLDTLTEWPEGDAAVELLARMNRVYYASQDQRSDATDEQWAAISAALIATNEATVRLCRRDVLAKAGRHVEDERRARVRFIERAVVVALRGPRVPPCPWWPTPADGDA